MFGKGLFGGLFDLDNNGEMSPEELALEMLLFDELTRDDEEDDEDIYDDYYDDNDDLDDFDNINDIDDFDIIDDLDNDI